MSHREQREFCKTVKKLYPEYFNRKIVADVGSLDINGNNRYLFKNCDYFGIDIMEGENVDIVGLAHEEIPELNGRILRQFYRERFIAPAIDVCISTEALEHDKHWDKTLKAIYDHTRGAGLVVITCAGDGRAEHGTVGNHEWTSPATNDYYRNISNEMFASVLKPYMFQTYYLTQDKRNFDLQFFGIKK